MWLSTQRIGKDIRTSSYFFTRRAADVVSEACFTAMTGDRHDERAAMDLSMIIFALPPSWFVWILTVIQVWLYFLYLVIFFNIFYVFQLKTLYTIRVLANCAWKPLKLALSILFSIWGFSSLLTFYNVNYSAWYVYKPLFGSSVATCQLECSEISLSIIEK